ncbi:MAG: oligoendopeptidase F [Spirochaetia bacterium]
MNTIPKREEVPEEYRWDLSSLYKTDEEWETAFNELNEKYPKQETFKGTLGESAENLKNCLDFRMEVELLAEKLVYYAHLKVTEDSGNSENQGRLARFMQTATAAEAAGSFMSPEIQNIPDDKMEEFLKYEGLSEYRIFLKKLLRFKPHVLSEQEERILAMQMEANQTPHRSFEALTDVDMDFGTVKTKEGEKPLSQSTFGIFLENTDREIRKNAYRQFYGVYEANRNTLASLYAGSVSLDIYRSRVRKYGSSREAALFPDKVPGSVYDNLVQAVNNNLEPLHRYYGLRKKILGLDELRHYDVRVPLVGDVKQKHSYGEAVDLAMEALAPLGDEYRTTLRKGLLGGWVDRYENKGKRSGAFSAGSYAGDPYILLNFQDEVIRHVFTLIHESGHSMHSYYSSRENPFPHYQYTIFEAEVASTFNEQLLFHYLMDHTESKQMKVFLINNQIDEILGTLYRQTMFAEYEDKTHKMAESGQPLTVDSLRNEYRNLLERYFGPEVVLEENSDMEGLRVPHFYRAFYVYKYATGISAAITLAKKVLSGETGAVDRFYDFLKSGGSKYPIDALKDAGVDMTSPEPVNTALDEFSSLLTKLERELSAG